MKPLKVLLVDDDKELASFIKTRLSKEAPRLSIHIVEDGRECIEYLKANEVDCILSDFQMPGMDGLKLLKTLKSQSNDTPFIFLTGQGNEDLAREAFKSGAYDYFTKEIGFAHFTRIINSIEQAARQREAERSKGRAELALKQSALRFREINECFLSFGADPLENINRLTALCGKLLGAACALYNRLDKGMLCSWGMWNAPPDYNPVDRPEGHLCYDVIRHGGERALVVKNLPDTPYAKTDPNVTMYNLRTYMGQAVRFADEYIGSLCVVYNDDFDPGDEDLKVLQIIASAIGVEEKRRAAEEKLARSEERFRVLTESTSDWVWEVDTAGTYTYASPKVKDILGYAPEEVVGKRPFDFMSPGEAARVRKKFGLLAFSGEPVVRLENVNATKDGRLVVLETSAVPVLDASGRLIGYRGIDRDITERKKLEEQEADFLAMVTHDLRSPITAILGYTDMVLENKDRLDDDILEMLEDARHSGKKLMDIVDDFLIASRLEAGKIRLDAVPVDISTMLRDIKKDFARLAEKRGVSLSADIPDLPVSLFDTRYIERAVANLLQNALDYTHKGGKVILKAESGRRGDSRGKAGAFIAVSVQDTGPGIPEDDMEKIFEKYYRSHAAKKRKGSGLGLAIVKAVVEAHSGTVSVQSEPGKGSTFTMSFPVSK